MLGFTLADSLASVQQTTRVARLASNGECRPLESVIVSSVPPSVPQDILGIIGMSFPSITGHLGSSCSTGYPDSAITNDMTKFSFTPRKLLYNI
jgi:hypothetical protein